MTAPEVTAAIVRLADAYQSLGPENCETAAEFARRRLTERRAGESVLKRFPPGTVDFVSMILEGFMRHRSVCDALFEGYCSGMKRNRQEATGMALMAYLFLHRFDGADMDAQTIAGLCANISVPVRLAEFCGFLGSRDSLMTHALQPLCAVVQDAYVEDFIIPTLVENTAHLTPHFSGESSATPVVSEHALCEPKAPAFVGKARQSTLPPDGVRSMQHTIPEPRKRPIAMQASDAELRAVAAAKFGKKLSTLHDDTRADNRAREAEIPFYPFTEHPTASRPRVASPTEHEDAPLCCPSVGEVRRRLAALPNIEVKTTKAAVQREALLAHRKQASEAEALAERVAVLRDGATFEEWQQQGRIADKAQREAELAERKLQTMLGDEEARMAKIHQQRRRHKESAALKRDIANQRRQNEQQSRQERAELHRQATEQRDRLATDVMVAKAGVLQQRHQVNSETREERRRNELDIAMQAELDRRRKEELIEKIKVAQAEAAVLRREAAQARLEANRQSNFGDTTPDVAALAHMPMGDMSFADLRRLLTEVSEERGRLVAAKRSTINDARSEERRRTAQLENEVLQHRERVRAERDAERVAKRREAEEKALAVKKAEEGRILQLQVKLAEKRQERVEIEAKRRNDERRRVVAAQLLMTDAHAVEQKKMQEMERAAANTVITNQNASLARRQVHRAISASEAARRDGNLCNAQRKLQSARALSDQILKEKAGALRQEEASDCMIRNAMLAELRRR